MKSYSVWLLFLNVISEGIIVLHVLLPLLIALLYVVWHPLLLHCSFSISFW